MRTPVRIFCILLLAIGGPAMAAESGQALAIAVHAGAGTINKADLDPEVEAEIRSTLEAAVRAGHESAVRLFGRRRKVSPDVHRRELERSDQQSVSHLRGHK